MTIFVSPLKNLLVGSILPLAIPPKSGTKHSTSVIEFSLEPSLKFINHKETGVY